MVRGGGGGVISRRPKFIHQLRGAAGDHQLFSPFTRRPSSAATLSASTAHFPPFPSAKNYFFFKKKEKILSFFFEKKMTHKDSEWNRLIQFRVLLLVPQQSAAPTEPPPASQFKRRWGASRALIQSNSFHAILRPQRDGWGGGVG